MKKVAIALLMAMLVTLSGCAALDSFFFEELRDPKTGEELFIDVEATKQLPEEMQDEGKVVLVKSSERIPGREYDQAYSDQPSEEFGAVGQVAGGLGGALGGWGVLIGPLLGGVFGFYSMVRGKRKVKAADLGKKAALLGAGEVAQVMKDYQDGLIDTNADGKVSFDEIKAYLAKAGKDRYANPEFVQKVLAIAESSMSKSEKQAALEKAAESL